MNFCKKCHRILKKVPNVNGTIMFECICSDAIEGTPYDTLMDEAFLEGGNDQKYDVLIENANHDPAAMIVPHDCTCGMKYMTLVRYGENETTQLQCSCGVIITND